MNDEEKRKEQLIRELADIRQRMAELNRSETQSKLAEEELVRSEERYRNLIELSPDMIALHSQGKYVYVNPAGIKMLGASGPEDLIGNPTFETIHPDYIEIVKERVRQLEEGKAVPLLEEKYIRLDGKIVDVEVGAAPIPSQGEPMVQVIARDITERKRMEAALRRSKEESQRLAEEKAVMAEIGRVISLTLNIEEVYERFAEEAHKLINFDRIVISIINRKDATVVNGYVWGIGVAGRRPGEAYSLAGSIAEEVMRARKTLLIQTESQEDLAKLFPSLMSTFQAGFRSMLTIPLFSRDQVIGVLHFRSTGPAAYADHEVRIAEAIAGQIAGAIANAQLFYEHEQTEKALRRSEEEAKRLAQENAVMAEIGRIISSTLNIEEVYERFAQEVGKLIHFDRIVVNLNNLEEYSVTQAYVSGLDMEGRRISDVLPLEGSTNEEVMRTRSGLILHPETIEELEGRFPTLVSYFQQGIRSMMSIPLIFRGAVIGALHFRSMKPKAYMDQDLRISERIADQIAGAIANAQLYNERRRAEEGLRESEQKLMAILQGSPIPAFVIGKDHRVMYWNKALKEMSGIEPAELIGTSRHWKAFYREKRPCMADLLVDEVVDRIPQWYAGKYTKSKFAEGAYEAADFFAALGEEGKWLRITAAAIRDSRGNLIGAIETLEDITERNRAEEAQRKSEEEANRLAQENAIMAEIGRIISSTLNIEEVYALFSEKVRSLLPYDRLAINLINEDGTTLINRYVEGDSAPERNVGEVQPKAGTLTETVILNRKGLMIDSQDENEIAAKYPGLLPEMRSGLRSFLSVPLISGDQPIGGLHFRSKRYGVYSEKDLKVAESIANQIAGAIANAQLFSKHERAEGEKASLQQQLYQSQKMEAIGKLAGGIAHDFNNLLTVINSNSQLGLMELKEWDPLREKLDSIQKAGERAANLTRQLLAFSRRQVVEMRVIDINALLQDLGKMLLRVIGEDIELKIVPDNNLGRVKADPGQIEQAILNLVVNARDAMPSGGKLTIETANMELSQEYSYTHLDMKPGRYVMLSVNDTGVGMVPEVREHIFEPFFTTKEKGKGTGLGLSTVYGVVKQSGGNIWVYSEPGQGTTFKVYLPQVDEPLEEARKKVVREKLPGGSETILVVEDEEEVRKLAVAILKKQGYRILEAAHGGDAFLICEQGKERIHLLLTDIVMPEMNGPELARRLRYFYPEMKVLFMSGYTDNAILQHGMLDKEMFFLQKPFSVDGLLSKVREALDN
jgi:two-component system cell cycle sensor histidine kinase/response regulator CckA